MKKTRFGFSLIELLVVIVIMGILATISLGTFQGFFAKSRDSDRRAVFSTLKTAIVADRTGSRDSFDITSDIDGSPFSNAQAYIDDLMDENELELSYPDGCMHFGYGTGADKHNFFFSFVREDDDGIEVFGSGDVVDAIENSTSVWTFDGTCVAPTAAGITVVELTFTN